MQLTVAKDLIREYFYRHYLTALLPPARITGSNYLVLLGGDETELRLLDELSVPRYRVLSVERNPDILLDQARRSFYDELGIGLYFGELTDFVRFQLNTNHRIQVLNLDVCGSYLLNIDPSMTDILLFARRNPRTIVATWSSAGRDRSQLPEGLKSLALCYSLAPEVTVATVEALYGRYHSNGLKPEVSLHMVLRHFFWVRSHWEHILLGAAALKKVDEDAVWRLIRQTNSFWQNLVEELKVPVTYAKLLQLVDRRHQSFDEVAGFDLSLANLQVVSYLAANGFYQVGWFCSYQQGEIQGLGSWLKQTLGELVQQPLVFARSEPAEIVNCSVSEVVPAKTVLWDKRQLPNHPRHLAIPLAVPYVPVVAENLTTTTSTEPNELSEKEKLQKNLAVLREAARNGKNTDEVMALLPFPMDRKSVSAHIAVSRRKPKL